jgi:hypothetical protein
MKLKLFPEDINAEYDLRNKVDATRNVHCEVRQGMYGLLQAGIIAPELLEERLLKAGHWQSKITPGYWKHNWRPISFTLVVDDFGVKYIRKEHVHHLTQTLKQHYEIKEDWEGNCYLGITLDWDYKKCKSTYPCQDMSNEHLLALDTKYSSYCNIKPTNIQFPLTEPQFNVPNQTMQQNYF